jgi:hypothetical protein
MIHLGEQILNAGLRIAPTARQAQVPARKLYTAQPLTVQEAERVRAVIADAKAKPQENPQ